MEERGTVYEKFKPTFARRAKKQEKIATVVSGGKETENIAEAGDYIIKNDTEAKESYVLKPEKFKLRYRYLKRSKDGYSVYRPLGKIIALEIDEQLYQNLGLDPERKFHLMAAWGEKMSGKIHDFLACPQDYSEVYLIARKEFFETYVIGR